MTGKKPDELRLKCPKLVAHVWGYFLELHGRRGSSGFGPNPISWGEIDAWARLRRLSLDPWELTALTKLDAAYMAHVAEEQRKASKSGDKG